ncbi:MFS general substrate transporter [Phellopilus nigrolimitatus]|nr:MFS general substrate transporter [Phellopilus nigrolimitatus]
MKTTNIGNDDPIAKKKDLTPAERQTDVVVETLADGCVLQENVGLQEYIEAQKSDSFDLADCRGLLQTPELNRKILSKIDRYVLSLMFITGVLQFLDKTALNYANLFGIRADLNLTGNQYSWLASLFYLGYLVAQFPASYLFSRFSSGKLLGVFLAFTWSKTFAQASACRFLLGVFEAPITPGITLAVGHWWTRDEAALRYNFIYSSLGWAGIIGSLMSTGISINGIDGPVKKWQLVFIVLGTLTIFWGLIIFFFLPDSPVDAKMFDHEECLLATARVASNQVGYAVSSLDKINRSPLFTRIKSGKIKLYQIKSSVLDFKTWCIVVSIFAAGIPNGVISNFSTELIENLGFSTVRTTLMDCVGNAFQVVGLMLGGYIASRYKNTRILIASAGNVACLIAAALMAYLPNDRTWMRLAAFWVTNLQSVSFSLGVNMISVNMAGYTKKQFASALTFISYCVGNIVGPHFVIQSQAPRFNTATKAMMIGFVGKFVCHAVLGTFMLSINRKRDRMLRMSNNDIDEEVEKRDGEARGMLDQTEFENKAFRYVL